MNEQEDKRTEQEHINDAFHACQYAHHTILEIQGELEELVEAYRSQENVELLEVAYKMKADFNKIWDTLGKR